MSQSVNEDLKHSQQFVEPLLATLQVCDLSKTHQELGTSRVKPKQLACDGLAADGIALCHRMAIAFAMIHDVVITGNTPHSRNFFPLLYLQAKDTPMIGTCDLQSLTSSIKETTDPARLKELLASARLALRIFYSMNNPGLTEVPHHPLCGSNALC